MSVKVLSLRLAEELAAELAFVARADGQSISDAVREALGKHIAERRADPDFQKSLARQIEEDRKLMQRLAGDS